jgi:hypothetical protein
VARRVRDLECTDALRPDRPEAVMP